MILKLYKHDPGGGWFEIHRGSWELFVTQLSYTFLRKKIQIRIQRSLLSKIVVDNWTLLSAIVTYLPMTPSVLTKFHNGI